MPWAVENIQGRNIFYLQNDLVRGVLWYYLYLFRNGWAAGSTQNLWWSDFRCVRCLGSVCILWTFQPTNDGIKLLPFLEKFRVNMSIYIDINGGLFFLFSLGLLLHFFLLSLLPFLLLSLLLFLFFFSLLFFFLSSLLFLLFFLLIFLLWLLLFFRYNWRFLWLLPIRLAWWCRWGCR